MKKNYIIILFLFLTAYLNSQNFRGNWNVASIESNGNTINLPPTATTPPNIFFSDCCSGSPIGGDPLVSRINGNGICNSFTTYFEDVTGNAISLIPYFDTSTNICNTIEETDFENLFFSILQQSGNLDYSFSNNLRELSITNSLGEIINLDREDAATNLLSGEWFLHYIWDYDILLENTFNSGLNIIFSDVRNNGESNFDGSSTCNGFSGTYDNPIQTSSFIRRNVAWTLIDCNSTDEATFESSYFNFFNNVTAEYIYTFEITGSGSDAILRIFNGNGSFIQYGRQALSVNTFTHQKTKLVNDVSANKLQLISDTILTNTEYHIYTISGKLIESNRLNDSNSISINTLSSGVYFLNITNSENQIENFKFLKK